MLHCRHNHTFMQELLDHEEELPVATITEEQRSRAIQLALELWKNGLSVDEMMSDTEKLAEYLASGASATPICTCGPKMFANKELLVLKRDPSCKVHP